MQEHTAFLVVSKGFRAVLPPAVMVPVPLNPELSTLEALLGVSQCHPGKIPDKDPPISEFHPTLTLGKGLRV